MQGRGRRSVGLDIGNIDKCVLSVYHLMELEPRKVQKLGYSSLGISLPKDWAESLRLTPGSMVAVIREEDGSLRIRAGPLQQPPETSESTIDVENCDVPGSLTRLITGAYVVGRNTIRIRSREEIDPEELQEIHDIVKKLTGLTIVNQGSKFVTIENFAEPTRFPIDGLLRRLHYLTSRMEKLAFDCVTSDNTALADEVKRLEEEADRLYWLVVRQLLLASKDRTVASNVGETDPRRIIGDRVVAHALEDIGDIWFELAKLFTEIGQDKYRKTKEFVKTMETLRQMLESQIESTMNSFFGQDWVLANNSMEIHTRVLAAAKDLESLVPAQRVMKDPSFCTICISTRSMLTPLSQISAHYAMIAQLTIDRALQATEGVLAGKK